VHTTTLGPTVIHFWFLKGRNSVTERSKKTVFLSSLTCWAPGIAAPDDWKLWAMGQKSLCVEKTSPALEFTSPLFRRRLSQISRMTVQVVHDLVEKTGCSRNTKMIFISERGEIGQELSINKTLIEEKIVMPATFSLSVFNAPIALASIAEKMTGGYSAVYTAHNSFYDGFAAAAAQVLSGREKEILLVYADEAVPKEYEAVCPSGAVPFAFALLLSGTAADIQQIITIDAVPSVPELFLKSVIKCLDSSFCAECQLN
jgi:hypothetical protein